MAKLCWSTFLLILLFEVFVHASPFLHKLDRIQDLRTSNPLPQQIRRSNIANLRKSKTQDLEKQSTPEAYELPTDVNEFNETAENEVTPGFIQKKIEKIFQKLQFFSNSFNEVFNTTGMNNNGTVKGLHLNRTLKVETDGKTMDDSNLELTFPQKQRSIEEGDGDRMPLSRVLGSLLNLTYKAFGIPIQDNIK